MALKRFKTDKQLWLQISLWLFFIAWFVPFGDMKGSGFPMIYYLLGIFAEPSYCIPAVVICSLVFGVPAVFIGWFIQAVVVMIREARHKS